MTRRILRLRDVQDCTGLSRATIYRLIRKQSFPAQMSLTGARAVGWDSQAVESWIESRTRGTARP